jgi:hypothetical protein
MDQQLSKIRVAALADAHEARFAAGCRLTRNEAEPRRQIATVLESLGFADRRDQRRRDHDADARDSSQSPGVFVFFRKGRELGLESGNPSIEV